MIQEAQRSSANIDPDIQRFLDEINTLIVKRGYTIKPIIQLKKCGLVPTFFIKRYQKYLIASFTMQKIKKMPEVKRKGI